MKVVPTPSVLWTLRVPPCSRTSSLVSASPIPEPSWLRARAPWTRWNRSKIRGSYEVDAHADGLQALAAIRRRLPDIVITDVMMPVMGGFQLLAALRADVRTRALPILIVSARAGEEARVEGRRARRDHAIGPHDHQARTAQALPQCAVWIGPVLVHTDLHAVDPARRDRGREGPPGRAAVEHQHRVTATAEALAEPATPWAARCCSRQRSVSYCGIESQ